MKAPLTVRLLVRLVRLLPRAFAEEYGADMVATLVRRAAVARSAGRLGVVWFALREAAGLGRLIVLERAAALGAAVQPRTTRQCMPRSLPQPSERKAVSPMEHLLRETRHALRRLLRMPGFTAVAVLTLGLGIGATTAIYAVLENVVLDPLPYPRPDRLVRLTNPVPGVGPGREWQVSPAQYLYFGEQARLLGEIGLYRSGGVNVGGAGEAVRAEMARATASVLRLLGARAAHGRLFDDEDDSPHGAAVVVLSHAFWERRFGGDPTVLGRTLELNGEPFEIIGVLARGTELPERGGAGPGIAGTSSAAGGLRTDVWVPYRLDPVERSGFFSHTVPAIARLARGATLETAQEELDRLTPGLMEAYPQGYGPGMFERYGLQPTLRPLKDDVVGDVAGSLWIVFGAVGLVLLIAAANVANLFVVRIDGRRHELAIRTALGASGVAVAAHYFGESLILSLAGAAVALVFGYWGIEWLIAAAPAAIPRLDAIRLDASVFAFALGATLLVAVGLAGMAALRRGALHGAAALVEGGRSATIGRERLRARSALVVGQVALALILITSAGLLLESFRRLRAVDPGVRPDGALTLEVHPSMSYDTYETRWQFYGSMLERVRALPGVVAAGVSVNIPFRGNYGCTVQGFEDGSVYARLDDAGLTTCAAQLPTSPGFFEALGIPVIAGRAFTARDNDFPETRAAIVSSAFAERFWPGENPLDKGVAPNGSDREPFYRVVGVVGDVYSTSILEEPALAIYYPVVPAEGSGGWSRTSNLVVRTSRVDPASLFPAIRRVVHDLDAAIPLANLEAMRTIVARSMSRQSFMLVLLGLAAAVALALAAIGLYGVIAYVVAQRTSEIGVRIALGARPRQIRWLVVAGSLRLVVAGLAVGALAALWLSRLLRGMLFGIEPTHPATYVAAAALLAAVAMFASWLPARRASAVDPITALRQE